MNRSKEMIIRKNIMAENALQNNRRTYGNITKNLEKLSSGYRINHAADDAAGLAISESMRQKIAELSRCQKNVQEGLDLANTAEGAL